MEDFTDPRTTRLDKITVRRGWLILLLIMLGFIALTKVFPGAPPSPAPVTGVAKPSH
jgi:hypothetical protein